MKYLNYLDVKLKKVLPLAIVALACLFIPESGSAFFAPKRPPGNFNQGIFRLRYSTYGNCHTGAWIQKVPANSERYDLNVNSRIVQVVGYEASANNFAASGSINPIEYLKKGQNTIRLSFGSGCEDQHGGGHLQLEYYPAESFDAVQICSSQFKHGQNQVNCNFVKDLGDIDRKLEQYSQSEQAKERVKQVTMLTSEVDQFKAESEQRKNKIKAEFEQLERESESRKERAQEEEKQVAQKESKAEALAKAACLTAETPIYVKAEDGLRMKPVSEVTLHDQVYSCDLGVGVCDFKRVVAVFVHSASDLYRLRFDDGQVINATGDHPFYEVVQGGWKEAYQLKPGDVLYSVNGERVKLESIEPLPGTHEVYNLEVSENHNYFANGVLTHNCDFLEKVKQIAAKRLAELADKDVVVPVLATVAALPIVASPAAPLVEGVILVGTAVAAGHALDQMTQGESDLAGANGGIGENEEYGQVGASDGQERVNEQPADRWSREPMSIQDQMALDAAKNGAGQPIIKDLKDPRYKGMEKWEYRVKSADGKDSVIHWVRDPKTGELMDFKFKKHSTQ